MTAYYNEIDRFAAAWLRELIKRNLIAPGEVDERSIADVRPDDLVGFDQVHFFAGIGVWSYALRRAGWPDDRPVWTGSCPCQPFSCAGKGAGFDDSRHLWPEMFRLIAACRPPIIFGEQVASRLVTGRFGGDGMQSLWEARQFLHFRKDWLEGNYPVNLQGMPEFGREKVREVSARQYPFASEQTSSGCQKEGSREGSSFRSGCRVGVGETRGRSVPLERRAIRPDGGQGILNTIAGQDRSKGRLHEGEHASNPVWAECSPWDLGGEEAVRCGDKFDQDAVESINDLIAEISCELEEEDGESWINTLQLDLGRSGYTVGACVAPAAGFGAPHIRQRLYWMAHSESQRSGQGQPHGARCGCRSGEGEVSVSERCGADGGMANAAGSRHDRQEPRPEGEARDKTRLRLSGADGADGRLGNPVSAGPQGQCGDGDDRNQPGRDDAEQGGSVAEAGATRRMADAYEPGLQPWERDDQAERYWHTVAAKSVNGMHGPARPTNGHWRDADWLFCRDGKWRAVSASPQPMVDGIAESLGRVCNEHIYEIEEEIDAAAMETKIEPAKELRNLWGALIKETQPEWAAGGIPGLHEATFLLAFMRQLSEQGWKFAKCVPVSRQKTHQKELRSLRAEHRSSRPSHQHELAGQSTREHSNALCVLSSILARHAHKAWRAAHAAYAESCFPLTAGATARVGRLRGYGNAIVAPQAAAFIGAVMEEIA